MEGTFEDCSEQQQCSIQESFESKRSRVIHIGYFAYGDLSLSLEDEGSKTIRVIEADSLELALNGPYSLTLLIYNNI